ncbi:MAG: PHP domain-containing protein [Planctomycetes bacterium]|nr:PHP domain-containing protein [Planctomycetota bacterium]
MLDKIMIDTHTHTVLSGHAWSTLRENCKAAAERGMHGICLTEHGPAMQGGGPFFMVSAQRMLPEVVEGIRVYKGIECNIVDFEASWISRIKSSPAPNSASPACTISPSAPARLRKTPPP